MNNPTELKPGRQVVVMWPLVRERPVVRPAAKRSGLIRVMRWIRASIGTLFHPTAEINPVNLQVNE